MRLITLLTIVFFSFNGFSQSIEKLNEQKQDDAAQRSRTLTLVLNLRNVSKNDQGSLKDDFLSYNEKLISLNLNESEEILTLVHNSFFSKEEVLEVLKRHDINNSAINSYK